MKTFYVVIIKKNYEEAEFRFTDYGAMCNFLEYAISTSTGDCEFKVKKVDLPFSESDGECE